MPFDVFAASGAGPRRAVRYPLVSATLLMLSVGVAAQQPSGPRFDVVSVKPNTTDAPPSSRFPLGPGDAFLPGTLFSATNQPLIAYLRFAFGRSQGELLRLPSWIYDERFDIEARATGAPNKEDMRMMVRALLVERFGLAWHFDRREEPVMELVLARPGVFGPQLTRHGPDEPCGQDATGPRDSSIQAIPCGSAGLVPATTPGRSTIAGRKQPIARLAALLSNNSFAGIDRVVLDRTGLTEDFDFKVEWLMSNGAADPLPGRAGDDTGPGLAQALREQLGLTLRPAKGQIDVLVIDHIERPSAN